MIKTLEARERIYNHIEDHTKCGWHTICSHTDSERYCIAKDTIQDTAEALIAHREQDFVGDVYCRYIEYYGILQAVYMQQDAIMALSKLFKSPVSFDNGGLPNWHRLRDLRNCTVGHPVGRLMRLNRNGIAYDCVNYLRCPTADPSSWESRDENLAVLLDEYDIEAAGVLDSVYSQLEVECDTKHS